MKPISNLVLRLNRAVLAEGLAFAEAIGVAPAAALEVLQGSNAYSRAMDVKGRKLVERDYTVQAKLSQHLKDVRLMLGPSWSDRNKRMDLSGLPPFQALGKAYGSVFRPENSLILIPRRPRAKDAGIGTTAVARKSGPKIEP